MDTFFNIERQCGILAYVDNIIILELDGQEVKIWYQRTKQVSLKSKTTIYKVIIKPVLLYVFHTWPTKGNEEKIAVLESRLLRRIYRPKK